MEISEKKKCYMNEILSNVSQVLKYGLRSALEGVNTISKNAVASVVLKCSEFVIGPAPLSSEFVIGPAPLSSEFVIGPAPLSSEFVIGPAPLSSEFVIGPATIQIFKQWDKREAASGPHDINHHYDIIGQTPHKKNSLCTVGVPHIFGTHLTVEGHSIRIEKKHFEHMGRNHTRHSTLLSKVLHLTSTSPSVHQKKQSQETKPKPMKNPEKEKHSSSLTFLEKTLLENQKKKKSQLHQKSDDILDDSHLIRNPHQAETMSKIKNVVKARKASSATCANLVTKKPSIRFPNTEVLEWTPMNPSKLSGQLINQREKSSQKGTRKAAQGIKGAMKGQPVVQKKTRKRKKEKHHHQGRGNNK
ncbi:uncharacterized protein LOC122815090 [Protopterus annectens]|uniref:uncharacterized protein LOC122815090 n=1 Tax=Protopterus annectens TaxID=7888 RepID=UPI001CFB0ECB|nr:uncharacterized protein LOC122815090 [Protopterus annectens]